MDWLKFENEALNLGYKNICGVDEAGRGPLAGPVFAAAVIFEKGVTIDDINDSKKLTQKKRERLCEIIQTKAKAFAVEQATVSEICKLNILQASLLAMRRAISSLSFPCDFALIDGNNTIPFFEIPSRAIVKGDSLSLSIAAASILAKVYRDRYMLSLDLQYPNYAFAKHKGYPTALHKQMLQKYGPCSAHRSTFRLS